MSLNITSVSSGVSQDVNLQDHAFAFIILCIKLAAKIGF